MSLGLSKSAAARPPSPAAWGGLLRDGRFWVLGLGFEFRV